MFYQKDVETMRRAMEDPSSPNDFRAYQQGDPLKRIHWKMSARKRELIVKQFEEPALPDALVMLDTSPPQLAEGMPEDQSAFLKDALLETAASVPDSPGQSRAHAPGGRPAHGVFQPHGTAGAAGRAGALYL